MLLLVEFNGTRPVGSTGTDTVVTGILSEVEGITGSVAVAIVAEIEMGMSVGSSFCGCGAAATRAARAARQMDMRILFSEGCQDRSRKDKRLAHRDKRV